MVRRFQTAYLSMSSLCSVGLPSLRPPTGIFAFLLFARPGGSAIRMCECVALMWVLWGGPLGCWWVRRPRCRLSAPCHLLFLLALDDAVHVEPVMLPVLPAALCAAWLAAPERAGRGVGGGGGGTTTNILPADVVPSRQTRAALRSLSRPPPSDFQPSRRAARRRQAGRKQ